MQNLRIAADTNLAISTDCLVEGRHYGPATRIDDLGHKCLAVNLSDLAAMGATPLACSLTVFQEKPDPGWKQRFLDGFEALRGLYRVQLLDQVWRMGPAAVCVEVYGSVPSGKALTRRGARPGDRIYLSGTPGDAALVYRHDTGLRPQPARYVETLRGRLDRPQPRVELGLALVGIAHSAIDISDGLAQDLGHILKQSGCGARLDTTLLPVSDALREAVGEAEARQLALTGGDDYELCFTVPQGSRPQLQTISQRLGIRLTDIGTVDSRAGLRCVAADGRVLSVDGGYDHFHDG